MPTDSSIQYQSGNLIFADIIEQNRTNNFHEKRRLLGIDSEANVICTICYLQSICPTFVPRPTCWSRLSGHSPAQMSTLSFALNRCSCSLCAILDGLCGGSYCWRSLVVGCCCYLLGIFGVGDVGLTFK
ncbi:hypothetical protein CEXT_164761 [Caerostris extrusa]|uniref:Uncharacterized protein n=1 Tax=Caerostris extrusa TaxID=172846 RepID=A0AAV4TA69_CAEEX|nr:hypothetical protein CEXT_164761 [Caerostris extrusa]